MRPLIHNKKGQMGIIFFFIILFSILILGFLAAMTVAVVDFGSDTITPILGDLGMVGETNLSEVADYTTDKVNIAVQALPWLLGLSYILALVFSIVFVIALNFEPPKFFIGFYFGLMILLIFGGIIMSNMYEDIYEGTDEIATRLQEQPLISYMLLWSPWILSLIAFIAGIFFFVQTGVRGGAGI